MNIVLQYLLGFIVFAIVITVVVSIHEGGHFYFAKKAGILCYEFSIGMGPVIYQKKKGETMVSLRCIPFGGYVSMAGEEVEDDLLKNISQVRVVFNKDKEVTTLVLNLDNPKYKDLPLFNLVSYSLKGTMQKLPHELTIVVAPTDKRITKTFNKQTKKYDVEETFLEGNMEAGLAYLGKEGSVNNNLEVVTDCNNVTLYPVRNMMINYAKKEEIQIATIDRNMNSAPCGKRAMAVFAGPMMNFVLAFLIFLFMGVIWGYPKTNATVIDSVSEGTPVYLEGNGLKKNDTITHINVTGSTDSSSYDYNDVKKWDDISNIMNEAAKGDGFTGTIKITYKRGDTTSTIDITPIVAAYSMEMVFDYASVKTLQPVVGDYGANMSKTKAYVGGLRVGDKITRIKYNLGDSVVTKDISSISDILVLLNSTDLEESKELTISYLRTVDGEEKEGSAKVSTYSKGMLETQKIPMTKVMMGISPVEGFDIVKLLYMPFVNIGQSSIQIFKTIGLLFSDSSVKVTNLSGPIGIFNLFSSLVGGGNAMYNILYWTALISVNLGLFNLFPIPALDGSKLVEIGYEKVTKKKANSKVMNTIYTIGFILLMGLFVIVAISDVLRLFGVSI